MLTISNLRLVETFFVTLALNKKRLYYIGRAMNSYLLTSMGVPGDERMAQIMHEVAEDARESTRRAAEHMAAGIETASQAAQEKWGDTINRIKKWQQIIIVPF